MVRKKGVVWFLGHQPPPFKVIPVSLISFHAIALGLGVE